MKLVITNEQSVLEIDEAKIKKILRAQPELSKFRLSIVYLDDEQISVHHERYLKISGPTDVLTFPLGPNEGEILVSAETALREAKERGIEPEGELLHYTYHGILHLLGYDDHSDREFEEMHAKEKEFLTSLGYSWDWD